MDCYDPESILCLYFLLICLTSSVVCVCVCVCVCAFLIVSRLDLLIVLLSLIADTRLVRGGEHFLNCRLTAIFLSTNLPLPDQTSV